MFLPDGRQPVHYKYMMPEARRHYTRNGLAILSEVSTGRPDPAITYIYIDPKTEVASGDWQEICTEPGLGRNYSVGEIYRHWKHVGSDEIVEEIIDAIVVHGKGLQTVARHNPFIERELFIIVRIRNVDGTVRYLDPDWTKRQQRHVLKALAIEDAHGWWRQPGAPGIR